MSCFDLGYHHVNLFGKNEHEPGLYKNQLGAIGAATAHFSVRSEPALITMPTGTGKTAVMILLSYIFRAKKVLVITPSQLVRKQIAEQFGEAKLLVRNHILKTEFLPKVYELKREIVDKETWDSILAEHDVCVAIPGTLNKIIADNPVIATEAFDLICVDEAHHSRASSWTNLLEYFKQAKQVLLTATPFRRDKKDIKARLIYSFPLKQAYKEGLFSEIKYVPVSRPADTSDDQININIAKKAEEVYKNRAHQGHKIIIRTDGKTKANELLQIYKAHTKLNLCLIHSGLGDVAIEKRIQLLKDNKIDGILCVDMMGEGYDFPALKIAAIHVPHKSLSITLQFIGRIARTNIEESKVATVIASEHDFLIESEHLYRESSDWSIILPDLHRKKIEGTQQEQDFSDSFETIKGDEEMPQADVSALELRLENFLPFFHAKLYRVFPRHRGSAGPVIDVFKPIDFSRVNLFSNPTLRHFSISREHRVAIHVVSQMRQPPWVFENDSITDITNELVIVYYNEDKSILFICSTVKETELYEHIAESLLESNGLHEMIYLPHLKRVMAGWENAKLYNVGMKSRKTKGNYEAYKQILGSLAQNGVLPSDKYSYTRGHSFGSGYDSVLKKEMMIGVSTSSKVWSLDEKKIIHFIGWCDDLAAKITDASMDTLVMPLSDLDTGTVVNEIPAETIFFADWDATIYEKNTVVGFFDDEGTFVEEALLCSCDIVVGSRTGNELDLEIRKDVGVARLIFGIDPTVSYRYHEDTPCKLFVKQNTFAKDPDVFLSIMRESPIHLFFEDLSSLAGKVYYKSNLDIDFFPVSQITQVPWPANVNVRKEFYTAEERKNLAAGSPALAIHDYILESAIAEFDAVFYDHSSLEIADVIGFKKGQVKFYHCKKQDGDNPRCSVDDMYEVIGQAVKSVHWSNRKILNKQLVARADINKVGEKIKKGSLTIIKEILNDFDSPNLPVEIVIVQPGLKSTGHSTNQADAFKRISILLSGAEEYLKAVSSCQLRVMSS